VFSTGAAILPSPEVAIPQAFARLQAEGLGVPFLQLDGWWMNTSTLTPSTKFFPHGWSAFVDSLQQAGVNHWLLYKAFFSEHYDLFDRYAKVQSNLGTYAFVSLLSAVTCS
jgi:hypothetical protein